MFKINFGGNEYKVRFKHYSKAVAKEDGTIHQMPEKTTCLITKNQAALYEGTAKPIKEIAVIVPNITFAEQKYRRKLKHVYRLENGTMIALVKGDAFCYADGRRASLEKALESFDRATRKLFWDAYQTMGAQHKETIDVVKVLQAGIS